MVRGRERERERGREREREGERGKSIAYVGPMPPDVTTMSYFSLIRLAASIISSSSSAMTSTLLRLMPNEKQNLAK